MNSPRRTYNPLKPLSICLFGLLALVALVAPSGALAMVEGGATLKLAAGPEGLRAEGTTVRGIGEAKQRGARFELPAAGLKLDERTASVSLRGAIRLRAGKQSVLLRRLQVQARGRTVAVRARLGSRELTVLRNRLQNRKGTGNGTDQVQLAGLDLTLTGGAAKLLGERLGVEMQSGGKAGRLRLAASRPSKAPGPVSGGQTPTAGPITNEPRLLERPATAVDVSGVEVSWFPRDSWVRYVSTGTGPNDGIFTGNGASAVDSTASPCPDRPSGSSAMLPYTIDFTPAPSWYDPVSGKAGIYGSGDVAFRWASHTIDLSAANPEVEINGTESRVIFRFNGGAGTPYPNQRADLVSLDVAAGPTQVSDDGKTFSYELVRGTLTANGVNVFAGFYPPPDNDEFGCVSVKFTTP